MMVVKALLVVAALVVDKAVATLQQRTLQQDTNTTADEDFVNAYRVIFTYINDEGKNEATASSQDNELFQDIGLFNIGSIVVESEEELVQVIEALIASDNIQDAAIDEIKDISPHEYHDPEEERRRMKEDIPYGVTMVQADQLWDLPPASGSVDVCVIDTGIDNGHEDLPNTQDHGVTGITTFENPIYGVWDDDGNGHGTHCAGTIGAIGDNGVGVVGVRKVPAAFRFHIGKALSDLLGAGSTSTILAAVASCYDSGAKVISMSLGGSAKLQLEQVVYDFLYKEGILVIAAAGNEGNTAYSYPASYDNVMSVAAVDSNMEWADFSQFNDQVDIAAPGVAIRSTIPPNDYGLKSGTSMATPHVAGVAAEVWSHFPDCSNSQIKNVLLKTALDLGPEGYDNKYGHGLVQAKAAYDLLMEEGCGAGNSVTAGNPTSPPPTSSAPRSLYGLASLVVLGYFV